MDQKTIVLQGVGTSWMVTVRMIVAGIIQLSVMALRQPKALTAVWRMGKNAVRLVAFLAVPERGALVKK